MRPIPTEELIERARALAVPFAPSRDCTSGGVGVALLSAEGNLYTGVCVDTSCSLGFCAEHAAIAEMLKCRESQIRQIVAVNKRGEIVPPCGRCRELMWQVDVRNTEAEIILPGGEHRTLKDLLPHPWR